MLDALLNILNGFTNIPFVELAWSHAPDDKYGVISLDNQIALDADADPVSEKMLTGFVDVFVKKPKDLTTASNVENTMKLLGIWFALNSVQFEDDTGYVHYEWEWKDTPNIVTSKLYVIKFYNGVALLLREIVAESVRPTPPTISDYYFYGLRHTLYGWNPTITKATQNATYTAQIALVVTVTNGNAYNYNGEPLTQTQLTNLLSEYNGGHKILVIDGNYTYPATSADNESVHYRGKSATWVVG